MRRQRVSITNVSVTFGAVLIYVGMVFAQPTTLTWTEDQLKNYIYGSWLAKCAGGALGGPLEGAGTDTSRGLPALTTGNIGDCNNDDVYVQIPFLATMSGKSTGANGIYSATMQDYGNALKNTTFSLWWGNDAARGLLSSGVIPPYSGGWPQNGNVRNTAAEAIDWQIECQFVGYCTPGMPAACVKLDSICGHVIGYADGIYAGTLYEVASTIGPLYVDIHSIIKEAIKAIPVESSIHKNTDTLIWYHDNNPTKTYIDAFDWATGLNGQTRHCNVTPTGGCNQWIDAKQNAAIVMIAALWCDNSITKAVTWAARMGGDVDCNCGDVCGIVGSMLGLSNLPAQWVTTWNQAMAGGTGCSFGGTGVTGWDVQKVLSTTLDLAKKAILQEGGTFANNVYTIPVQGIPAPRWLEQYGKVPVALATSTSNGAASAIADRQLSLQIAPKGGDLRIQFEMPADQAGTSLSIELLDQRGRMVSTLVKGTFGAGSQVVNKHIDNWGSGCYLARVRTQQSQNTVRILGAE